MRARLGTALIVCIAVSVMGVAAYAAVPASAAPEGKARCTIVGTNAADVLLGTVGRDVICGRGGNDELYGFDGDDILIGGAGKDRLYGGSGEDELTGGAGSDYMQGERGSDDLRGGSGDDDLRGEDSDTTVDPGPGEDEDAGADGDVVGDVASQLTVVLAVNTYMQAGSKILMEYWPPSGNCLSFISPDRTLEAATSMGWTGGPFRFLTTRADGSCFFEESYGWWAITISRKDGSVSKGSLKVAASRIDGFSPYASTHCANFPRGADCQDGATTAVKDDVLSPFLRFR